MPVCAPGERRETVYSLDGKNKTEALKLSRIIACGLIAAMIVLAAGFFLSVLKPESRYEISELKENTFGSDYLLEIIRNTEPGKISLRLSLVNYAGIFILTLVPVAGLIYILSYYIVKRKTKNALITAGVIIMLSLSAVIGFLK